jgi:diguanylate cyclase (GGDEF)-like protein
MLRLLPARLRLPALLFVPLLAGLLAMILADRLLPGEAMQPRLQMLDIAVWVTVMLLVLLLARMAVRRHQAELERLATHDALTGCLNRQAFELVLQSFMRDARRSQQPLSVLLFDIDHFRRLNDSEGHQAGDNVLRRIAGLARESLRESDVIARWDGGGFMVLLNDCRRDMALQLAENLRLRIATHDFDNITRTAVTVSLGVAQYDRDESETAFFSRLDNALDLARDNGRNRSEAA